MAPKKSCLLLLQLIFSWSSFVRNKRKIDGQTVREKDFFGALMASKVEQDELDNALTGFLL
jgi:hypothetical protein